MGEVETRYSTVVGEGRLVKRRGWVLSIALELVMEVHELSWESGFTGRIADGRGCARGCLR